MGRGFFDRSIFAWMHLESIDFLSIPERTIERFHPHLKSFKHISDFWYKKDSRHKISCVVSKIEALVEMRNHGRKKS